MAESLLRLPTVQDRTGLSRASIYAYIAKGKFPKPVLIGAKAVGWPESTIESWIQSRINPQS